MLPSMTDSGPGEPDGDTEPESRNRRDSPRKGVIDRQKRDATIKAHIERRRKLAGRLTARPSIRQYYEEEEARRRLRGAVTAR